MSTLPLKTAAVLDGSSIQRGGIITMIGYRQPYAIKALYDWNNKELYVLAIVHYQWEANKSLLK